MESDKEVKRLKTILIKKLSEYEDKQYQRDNPGSQIFRTFSLSTKMGKRIYESFSDEEILAYLRSLAIELNHAPAQKEVFWVLRDYIKQRFGKWPYALKAAGLKASAGRGGVTMAQTEQDNKHREQLLLQVREKALELGKMPHPKDLPDTCKELKKYYTKWPDVLEAAGVKSKFLNEKTVYMISDLEPDYQAMLESIRAYSYEIGRSPGHGEIDSEIKRKLIQRCGSWRNALYQIGLEPIMQTKPFYGIFIDHRKADNRSGHTKNLQNCVYKVLNLSEADKEDFEELARLQREKGGIPDKKDVPKELRLRLQKACGSWVNVLYQIGIAPADYYRALKGVNCSEK